MERQTINIRAAIPEDAIEVCKVVRMSIEELCVADHQGDQAILDQWLANKTPETVTHWFTNPDNINLVAVDCSGAILGCACVRRDGEVLLNYVKPAARFLGVSNALLAALENAARAEGNAWCVLDSTRTAHRFYRERGYSDVGETRSRFGLTVFPMRKSL